MFVKTVLVSGCTIYICDDGVGIGQNDIYAKTMLQLVLGYFTQHGVAGVSLPVVTASACFGGSILKFVLRYFGPGLPLYLGNYL